MSMPIITLGPSMANPEAFDSVPELRAELERSNRLLLETCQQLHSLTCAAHDMSRFLHQLVDAHKEGHAEKVIALLDMAGQQPAKAPDAPLH